ncbi:MAG: hypothetical protein ACLFRG_20335 [Desulfococcaceae bacterium]
MANHRNKSNHAETFTPQEMNFFKRMSPRVDQPVRLATETKSTRDPDLGPASRLLNPAYLVALVSFAGILFFLTGAI